MIVVKREYILPETLEFNDELMTWDVLLTCGAKVRAGYIVLSLTQWYFDGKLTGCIDCQGSEPCVVKEHKS